MSELGEGDEAWLEVLRKTDEPTAADRDRVRALVLASVAAAGGATVASGTLGKAGGLVGLGWKIAVAAVSLGMLIGGGVWVASSPGRHGGIFTAGRPVVRTKLEASAVGPAAAGPSAADEAAPDDDGVPGGYGVQPEPAVRPGRPVAKVPYDDIEAELGLLSRAQRALSGQDPMLALQLLGEHRAKFPRGSLHVEREGLYAVAACEAKRPEGPKLASRFLQTFPASPLGARVQAVCFSR